jgi:hypothetical protein
MNSPFRFFFGPTTGPAGVVLIRMAVGLIFFTQGILKYIDPNMGVVRFTRIGLRRALSKAALRAVSATGSKIYGVNPCFETVFGGHTPRGPA